MPAIVKRRPTRSQACSWRGGASTAAPAAGQEGFRQEARARRPASTSRARASRTIADCRRRDHAAGPVVAGGQRQVLDAGGADALDRVRAPPPSSSTACSRVVSDSAACQRRPACLPLQRIQQRRGVAVVRRPAAPVQGHRCHAPVVQRGHQDGEHARETRAGGQQYQMVRTVL